MGRMGSPGMSVMTDVEGRVMTGPVGKVSVGLVGRVGVIWV